VEGVFQCFVGGRAKPTESPSNRRPPGLDEKQIPPKCKASTVLSLVFFETSLKFYVIDQKVCNSVILSCVCMWPSVLLNLVTFHLRNFLSVLVCKTKIAE
jgi:hypothetical protein